MIRLFYLTLVCGGVALGLIWVWALRDGIKTMELITGIASTVVMSAITGAWAASQVNKHHHARFSNFAVSVLNLADDGGGSIQKLRYYLLICILTLGFMGLCVIMFEYVPSKFVGQGMEVSRRYSITYFAITGHLIFIRACINHHRKS